MTEQKATNVHWHQLLPLTPTISGLIGSGLLFSQYPGHQGMRGPPVIPGYVKLACVPLKHPALNDPATACPQDVSYGVSTVGAAPYASARNRVSQSGSSQVKKKLRSFSQK